jgi:hypothetical protein
MTILTFEKAMKLTRGNKLAMNNHKNADGTCVRWKVNGVVKTWKTQPERFEIPVKHGMSDYGYVTEKNYFYFHINGSCTNCG